MFLTSDLEILSKYISITHHIKGRIRLKIDSKIQNSSITLTLDDFENLATNLDGIKSSKLNKLAKSLTIEYDFNLIEPNLWDELASGKNLENIATELNNLLKE